MHLASQNAPPAPRTHPHLPQCPPPPLECTPISLNAPPSPFAYFDPHFFHPQRAPSPTLHALRRRPLLPKLSQPASGIPRRRRLVRRAATVGAAAPAVHLEAQVVVAGSKVLF